jgi:predicted esterase
MAADADRHGYIIAAPVWPASTPKPYDYSGDQHFKATAVLRDSLRHYRVDNDRVYLWGFGDGANFAMDLGASP